MHWAPYALGFDGRANRHKTALGYQGHGTLDEQQLTGLIDAHHIQILGGNGFITHVSGHFLAGEHAPRILRHTRWNQERCANGCYRAKRAANRSCGA
jgi:hypothetical protein